MGWQMGSRCIYRWLVTVWDVFFVGNRFVFDVLLMAAWTRLTQFLLFCCLDWRGLGLSCFKRAVVLLGVKSLKRRKDADLVFVGAQKLFVCLFPP